MSSARESCTFWGHCSKSEWTRNVYIDMLIRGCWIFCDKKEGKGKVWTVVSIHVWSDVNYRKYKWQLLTYEWTYPCILVVTFPLYLTCTWFGIHSLISGRECRLLHKVRLTWRRRRSNSSRPEVSTAVLLRIRVFLDVKVRRWVSCSGRYVSKDPVASIFESLKCFLDC
jgi:hypothetical protein